MFKLDIICICLIKIYYSNYFTISTLANKNKLLNLLLLVYLLIQFLFYNNKGT